MDRWFISPQTDIFGRTYWIIQDSQNEFSLSKFYDYTAAVTFLAYWTAT